MRIGFTPVRIYADGCPDSESCLDESGLGIIGLQTSIRAQTECMGECRIGGPPAVGCHMVPASQEAMWRVQHEIG